MTVTEQPPGETTSKPAKPAEPAAPSGPTVRMVLTGAGAAVAAIVAVVAFVAGGWWVLGGVAAAGAAGTAVVAKARSTRPHKTRPGLLATWLTRSRRSSTARAGGKGMGSLPWSLTGNQSKRARTNRGGVPVVTAKGRARRAAKAASGKAPAKSTPGARPVARKTPGARQAGPGTTRRRTPTKTPEKISTRPRRTPAAVKAPVRPAASKGTARPRLAAAKKTTARPTAGPVSNGGKGAKVIPFRRPIKKAAGGTSTSTKRGTGAAGRRTAAGVRSPIKNPFKPTAGGKRLGSRRTGTGLASRARRLGTPKARYPRTNDLAVPKRTTRNPGRKAPATKRHLIRTALRVPTRTGRLRFRRPSKQAQARAKRTLWRRSRIAGRRALTWPLRATRRAWAARRPLPFWPILPTPIQDRWLVPNIPDPEPRERATIRRRQNRPPVPALTARRAPATTTTTPKGTPMNPIEAITEAYAQLTNFDPENAREIEAFMAALGPAHTQAAQCLNDVASRLSSDNPVHASVGEAIGQVAALLGGAGDVGDEANATFMTVHEHDLMRLNEPRAGEHKWDTTANQ